MSRRLVIILLIVLLIGVIGGAVTLVINRLQSGQPAQPSNPPGAGTLNEAPTGNQNIVDPTGDDDADGLPNADEALWGTDRKNPDTDNDGYFDGEEVRANYNPTVASPNDKLPEGFVPGKNVAPLPATALEPIAVDQFFQDNLDLSLGAKNYTEEYNKQYPVDTQNSSTLTAYVTSQPITTQLPTVAEGKILSSAESSPQTVAHYLTTANVGLFSSQEVYTQAVNDLFGSNNPSTIRGLAIVMRQYQTNLLATNVPASAVPLHKLLLGYSQVLAATFDEMAKINEDRVRAYVAVHQWEENDHKYIPLIEQETRRLKALAP